MGRYEHAGKHKKMDESAGKPSRGLVLILHLMGYKYGVNFLKQQQTKVKEKKGILGCDYFAFDFRHPFETALIVNNQLTIVNIT